MDWPLFLLRFSEVLFANRNVAKIASDRQSNQRYPGHRVYLALWVGMFVVRIGGLVTNSIFYS